MVALPLAAGSRHNLIHFIRSQETNKSGGQEGVMEEAIFLGGGSAEKTWPDPSAWELSAKTLGQRVGEPHRPFATVPSRHSRTTPDWRGSALRMSGFREFVEGMRLGHLLKQRKALSLELGNGNFFHWLTYETTVKISGRLKKSELCLRSQSSEAANSHSRCKSCCGWESKLRRPRPLRNRQERRFRLCRLR